MTTPDEKSEIAETRLSLDRLTEETRELRGSIDEWRTRYDDELARQRAHTDRRTSALARRGAIATAVGAVLLVGGGVVGWFWHSDQEDTAARFARLRSGLYMNCLVGAQRTSALVDLKRADLTADETSLRQLTVPIIDADTQRFAHIVFDPRIAAEKKYLQALPNQTTNCERYR